MRFFLIAALVAAASAATTFEAGMPVISIYGISPSEVLKESSHTGFTPIVTQRLLGMKDILESPIMVLRPNVTNHVYESYVVYNGFRSIKDFESFRGLFEYLKTTPELVGTVFYPKGIYNVRFFQSLIHRNIFPDNFKVSDYLKVINNVEDIPILLFLPREIFELYNFKGLTEVGRFGIYGDVIESVPVGTPEVIKTELPIH